MSRVKAFYVGVSSGAFSPSRGIADGPDLVFSPMGRGFVRPDARRAYAQALLGLKAKTDRLLG